MTPRRPQRRREPGARRAGPTVPRQALATPLAIEEVAAGDGHSALLCQDNAVLVATIARWAEAGLRAGEGVVVVARAGVRQQLRAALDEVGLQPGSLEALGQLRILDADATLRLFMVGGHPQQHLFGNVVSPLIEQAKRAAPAGEVRVWSEMADLLWHRAQGQAAVGLEGLWDRLVAAHPFRLFCAIHVDIFDVLQFPKVKAIAACHNRLVPAEDALALEAAVDAALAEVYGPEAEAVRAVLARAPLPGAQAPIAFRLLLALHELVPDFAGQVAARAGRHARGRAAARGAP